jgi:hypothetical protein
MDFTVNTRHSKMAIAVRKKDEKDEADKTKRPVDKAKEVW